ncbi:ShlB/FhaC/HecB family hemolysin secretion/activation protein [Helicobacter sp. 11S03491-1]|uniref:ShlB/FhaC/HecB family hemolysin secretion/activation protein n=1 Tax=Helicobacter sp. 11S03491-1 TaxID=1476196 RepID=UPI00117B4C21|nr:ShlB/FhaC/HecB family hemolysin secretion/activation protein [Helicobacter sp. 11S03491-1]
MKQKPSKRTGVLLVLLMTSILSAKSTSIQQTDPNPNLNPAGENPAPTQCFLIDHIDLEFAGESSKFKKKFAYAYKIVDRFKSHHPSGCLTPSDIINLLSKLQSRTQSKGYTTTRFGLNPQSLSGHTLHIPVEVGTIGKIHFIDEAGMLWFKKDFSIKEGEIFDLRKVEIGMNNLRNLRYINPQIYLTPDEDNPNESILSIYTHKLSLPVFLGATVDNGGSIGENYEISLYGSWENPLHLSDKLSFYALSSLPMSKKNHSYYISGSYFIPIRRVSISIDGSYSDSTQEIPFANITPVYKGKNINIDLKTKILLYADDKNQLSINLDGSARLMESYLDSIRLDVQSRNLADVSLGLGYQRKIANSIFNISLGVLQGLPLFKKHNEKFHTYYFYTIPNVNMYLYAPFKIWTLGLGYKSVIQTQISQDRLYASQKMSIGSRYTVRGFNHFSISAQMGVLYKNDLMVYLPSFRNIAIIPNIGIDWGMVRDLNSDEGGSLAGGGIGLDMIYKYFNAQISLNMPLYNPYKAPAQNLFFSMGLNW